MGRSSNHTAGVSSGRSGCRWPVGLWLSPIVVAVPLLAYGALRIVRGPELTPRLAIVLTLCAMWMVVAVLVALLRRTRNLLIAKRYQLALCFGSALLAVVVCDLALTAAGIVPTIAALRERSLQYQRSVYTRHRLVPKTLSVAGRENLTINSRGYLGPEITVPKPQGTTRIVFVGGSHVFAAFWSGGDIWPQQVGRLLAAAGRKVEIVNAAVPGHQTADCVGKLLTDLWLLEPDVVVVCNAWNDIKYFAELTPERPYCDIVTPAHGWDPRIDPRGIDRLLCLSAFYRMGHDGLVTMLAGVGDEGEVLREPVLTISDYAVRQYRLNLQTICDLGHNMGARVVLCKQARLPVPDLSPQQRQHIPYDFTGLSHDELIKAFAACDRVIDQVATEKGCAVIDMDRHLSGESDNFADHIHFSAEGGQKAAELVATQLESILDGPQQFVTTGP